MTFRVWPVAAALGVFMLVGTRLEPPLDVGTWSTEALPGDVVLALANDPEDDGVLIGTRDGLYHLHEDGRITDLGPVGRVHALAGAADRTWIGTDQGVLALVDGRLRPGPNGLPRTVVHGLDVEADGGRMLVASDDGVHELTDDGVTRLWPPPGDRPVPVPAVLSAPSGVLLAHPEGLARLTPDGRLAIVVPGAVVVALGQLGGPESVWAGTRGAPLLTRSNDGGRTWSPSNAGLGFSAVNALATDPTQPRHHLAGGSGLADGTGNAGTQWSLDDARTWQAEQDRLTNTHVFALAVTKEPVRVSLGLPATARSVSIPLPMTTPRWYAGTNGSGVATKRPELPVLEALASTAPYLRIVEPLLLGAVILAVLLPAYRRLTRARVTVRAPPRPPPTTSPLPTRNSTTNQETTDAHN